jgi:hypothetical protein
MPIPLRSAFDAPRLRAIAKKTKDAAQARRLLALAAICEGASRTRATTGCPTVNTTPEVRLVQMPPKAPSGDGSTIAGYVTLS